MPRHGLPAIPPDRPAIRLRRSRLGASVNRGRTRIDERQVLARKDSRRGRRGLARSDRAHAHCEACRPAAAVYHERLVGIGAGARADEGVVAGTQVDCVSRLLARCEHEVRPAAGVDHVARHRFDVDPTHAARPGFAGMPVWNGVVGEVRVAEWPIAADQTNPWLVPVAFRIASDCGPGARSVAVVVSAPARNSARSVTG
jgi:hypothetical protein